MIKKQSSKALGKDKVELWRTFLEKQLNWPVKFDGAPDEGFLAEAEFFKLGDVTIINHFMPPLHIERQAGRVHGLPRLFSLNLLRQGGVTLLHHSRESRLRPGDMVLADGAAPSVMTFDHPSYLITIRLPEEMLAGYLPRPEIFCNRPLSSTHGFGKTLRGMLHALWRQAQEQNGEDVLRLSIRPLLDLLALAFLSEHGAAAKNSKQGVVRLNEIKAFIRNNISNGALSPKFVAGEFGLSTRYLRKLFAAQADSTSKYIQRCRLQSCAEQLSNVHWHNISITDICFRSGFNSSAHFTRSFKAQFGMTPKEYRRHLLWRASGASAHGVRSAGDGLA